MMIHPFGGMCGAIAGIISVLDYRFLMVFKLCNLYA